jgi:hypothetical protein
MITSAGGLSRVRARIESAQSNTDAVLETPWIAGRGGRVERLSRGMRQFGVTER